MEYQSLSDKALRLMKLTALIKVALFPIVPSIVACIILYFNGLTLWALLVPAISLVAGGFYFFVVPPIRFRRYKYLIAEDRIEISEGIFWVSKTLVPIDRIHQIDVIKGPLDNIYGVAKVNVTTAGSSATFRFLELKKADEIALHLNNAVNLAIKQNKGAQDNV